MNYLPAIEECSQARAFVSQAEHPKLQKTVLVESNWKSKGKLKLQIGYNNQSLLYSDFEVLDEDENDHEEAEGSESWKKCRQGQKQGWAASTNLVEGQ